MARNEKLHEAFRVAVQAALSLLSSKQPVLKDNLFITFTNGGIRTDPFNLVHDWDRFLFGHQKELMELPELDPILQIADEDDAASTVLVGGGAEAEQQRALTTQRLQQFLEDYLTTTQNFTFDVETFEHVYEKLEEYIYRIELFDSIWGIHFRNLSIEEDRVELENGIFFRNATLEEREQAVRDATSFAIGPFDSQAILEIHARVDRGGPLMSVDEQQKATKIWQNALLALRLVNSGLVTYASTSWTTVDQPFFFQRRFRFLAGPTAMGFGDPYILTKKYAAELKEFWPHLKRTRKALDSEKEKDEEGPLAIALTRWEDSYGRVQDRDKLIDYWTAIDALFGSPSGEYLRDMGETEALAIAHYLGNTAGKRRSIHEEIRRSFEVRSHILHGKRGKPKHDVHEITIKTGERLRTALKNQVTEPFE